MRLFSYHLCSQTAENLILSNNLSYKFFISKSVLKGYENGLLHKIIWRKPILIHIFPKAQVTSNKMDHKNQQLFFWLNWDELSYSKQLKILHHPTRIWCKTLFEANVLANKTNHTRRKTEPGNDVFSSCVPLGTCAFGKMWFPMTRHGIQMHKINCHVCLLTDLFEHVFGPLQGGLGVRSLALNKH